MNRNGKRLQWLWIVLLIVLLLTGGCATNGALPQKILQGEEAIRKAAESNAALNAPGDLKRAEEKLAQAKEAAYQRDYDEAIRLAEQASLDADYARYKAASEKVRKTAEDLHKSIEQLRQEVDALSKQ